MNIFLIPYPASLLLPLRIIRVYPAYLHLPRALPGSPPVMMYHLISRKSQGGSQRIEEHVIYIKAPHPEYQLGTFYKEADEEANDHTAMGSPASFGYCGQQKSAGNKGQDIADHVQHKSSHPQLLSVYPEPAYLSKGNEIESGGPAPRFHASPSKRFRKEGEVKEPYYIDYENDPAQLLDPGSIPYHDPNISQSPIRA